MILLWPRQKPTWSNTCFPLHHLTQFETSQALVFYVKVPPLIFLVYDAPRVSWMGVEKGDITAFRQIPYERKKERLQLSSIKQWKHYKVIGSD